MKKQLKLFSLLLGGALVLAGCDNFAPNWPMESPKAEDLSIDTPWVDYEVTATSIILGKGENNLDLRKGDTHDFTYTVEPRSATLSSLTWESDNTAVATVENGHLTAVGGGSANILVSSGEANARARVTVTVPIENFEITNKTLDLDFGAQVQLVSSFTPEDTTQKSLTYEATTNSSFTVSNTGLVTALNSAGNGEIRVTNEAMNKVETVTVNVSDKWNYVSSFTLNGPANLEVTKAGEVTANVVGVDSSVPATTLRDNAVTYSVKEGSEDLISVDAQTGAVTALEPGDATIVGTLLDERSGETKTAECNIHVFEVSATAITISPTGTIELDNENNTEAQLTATYTLSDAGYEAPSRGNMEFISSDNSVATVDANGLVKAVGLGSLGTGTATITARDTRYNVSASVTVHNTIYAKSIQITKSGEFYLDEKIEITANVNPAKTSDNLVWDYDNTLGHTFEEDGNKLTITCNNLTDVVEVKAHVGLVESNVITLTPAEREINFENGKTYIVGSSNYKTGVSKDCGAEGSWQKAKYAFVMSDKTGKPTALYEYIATINFRENDLWKIRSNVAEWRNTDGTVEGKDYKVGYYKLTEGAFAKNQMGVTVDDNIIVKQAGKYDIYFAFFAGEHPEGWFEVYVEEHGLKLSSTSVHAKYTTPEPTVSTITASAWEGTLTVDDVDTSIINVAVNELTGAISITPVAVGETTFKVLDDVKEISVDVEVKAGSSATATTLYIRGSAASGWGTVSDDYVLRESEDDNNIGEILDVYLSEGEFKIANSDWSEEYGWDYDGRSTIIGGAAAKFAAGNSDNNIRCNVAGYYNIYLTTNHYIAIDTVGGDEASNLSVYYVRGTAVGSWDAVPANQMLTDDDPNNIAVISAIHLSVGEFKIANADWSKSWGYKYKNDGEAEDHITVIGGAAANFEEAASDCNIKCKVAGDYDIYLTTNNYISIESHSITPPEDTYTVSFDANTGTGTMADVLDQSGAYILPPNGFTAPAGMEFAGWKANNTGDTIAAGQSYTLTADVTFYAQWQAEHVANNVTIYLTANWGGWENPKAYVFDAATETPKAAWPGEAMTYVGVNDDNDTIFSYTVDINSFDTIIFSNGGSGDQNQTEDIDISSAVTGSAFYLSGRVGGDDTKVTVGTWSYTDAALTSKQIVYFTNNKGWSDPHVHIFNKSTSASLSAWPGDAAKWVVKNEYNQDVYRVLIDTTLYDSFIFNGGGNQTVDIALSSLTDGNNAFYALDTTDGSGHYEVGQYTFNPLA